MALLSTIWISLIALAPFTYAFQLKSLVYCITVREQDKLTFMDTTICPGTVPRIVPSPFIIFSGFPPGTWSIPRAVNKEYGCAVDCYSSQERMENPYYKFSIGDGRPDFSNRKSGHTGWHFIPPPDYCSNLNSLDDQRANEPVGFLPPANASKPAEGTTGNLISTRNVEGLGDPDELVGYAQLVSFIESSKWNVKRGVVRKKGAVAISFQA